MIGIVNLTLDLNNFPIAYDNAKVGLYDKNDFFDKTPNIYFTQKDQSNTTDKSTTYSLIVGGENKSKTVFSVPIKQNLISLSSNNTYIDSTQGINFIFSSGTDTYTLNIETANNKSANIFSIPVPVTKINDLFGNITIAGDDYITVNAPTGEKIVQLNSDNLRTWVQDKNYVQSVNDIKPIDGNVQLPVGNMNLVAYYFDPTDRTQSEYNAKNIVYKPLAEYTFTLVISNLTPDKKYLIDIWYGKYLDNQDPNPYDTVIYYDSNSSNKIIMSRSGCMQYCYDSRRRYGIIKN